MGSKSKKLPNYQSELTGQSVSAQRKLKAADPAAYRIAQAKNRITKLADQGYTIRSAAASAFTQAAMKTPKAQKAAAERKRKKK